MKAYKIFILFVFGVAIVPVVHGQPFGIQSYESFNYTDGSLVNGQGTGWGWDGTWQMGDLINTNTTAGIDWTSRTSAANYQWSSVCYANGLFVAVSSSGSGNKVMSSPDGITWTSRNSASDNFWNSVCYGNGLFVAVAVSGTGNRVMTSPDGINWTSRTSAADLAWNSVCYGNGLFVAIAGTPSAVGPTNLVMTSPNGIDWTIRTSAARSAWLSVCYGNGLFVAVSQSGTGNRVMTSPDGINWVSRASAIDNKWTEVCYGNGLFVAVAYSGTGNRIMTSPDGINWTSRTSPADNSWNSVCYGNGLFVAVAGATTGSINRVMTSPDGITWTGRNSAVENNWASVCYANGLFVAVAFSGTGNRVMTSGSLIDPTAGSSAYALSATNPFNYANPATSAYYITPGRLAGASTGSRVIGRNLDTSPSGPYNAWVDASGSLGGNYAGSVSFLLRKIADDDSQVFFGLSDGLLYENLNIGIGIGYFGSAISNANGKRYWTIKWNDGTYTITGKEIVPNKDEFFVASVSFNNGSGTRSISFYSDALIQNGWNGASLIGTNTLPFKFKSVFYYGEGGNSVDEIRSVQVSNLSNALIYNPTFHFVGTDGL